MLDGHGIRMDVKSYLPLRNSVITPKYCATWLMYFCLEERLPGRSPPPPPFSGHTQERKFHTRGISREIFPIHRAESTLFGMRVLVFVDMYE